MTGLIYNTDGYKVDHRRQYPDMTEFVYSGFTPRKGRDPRFDGMVNASGQYFVQKFLIEDAWDTFFSQDVETIVAEYQQFVDSYLGPNQIGTDHIRALHALGYMPLKIRSVPEGMKVPYGVPILTVENTLPEFFWLTNYFETLLSSVMWQACTSATTAAKYREILEKWAIHTGTPVEFVDWQGHDFSFRGMAGPEAAAVSGMGHLMSFTGTDSIPSIKLIERYYGGSGLIGGSVAATEHSVMCAGGFDTEDATFARLLKLYPTGILSVVSDTWNLWYVLDVILPGLKAQILGRDGKLVIRPDSGDPADILCGNPDAEPGTSEYRGVVETLYDLFGGTKNEEGFIVLDSHIGTIYGDSITLERAENICQRLADKGFATANVVFGIGSFTYQYVTRDNHGMAMKATHAVIDGKEHFLYKDPITDDGTKRSARGRMVVYREDGVIKMRDGLTIAEEAALDDINLLEVIFQDGKMVKSVTWDEVKAQRAT